MAKKKPNSNGNNKSNRNNQNSNYFNNIGGKREEEKHNRAASRGNEQNNQKPNGQKNQGSGARNVNPKDGGKPRYVANSKSGNVNGARPNSRAKQATGKNVAFPETSSKPSTPNYPKNNRPDAKKAPVAPKLDSNKKPVKTDKAAVDNSINKNSKDKSVSKKESKKQIKDKKKAIKAEKKASDKAEKKESNYVATSKANAKKNSIRGVLPVVAITAATIVVLAIMVNTLYGYIAAEPNLMFVDHGTIEHTVGARALIVRDESVVNTTSVGDLVTRATEGSRVAKGQEVALVVPENQAETVENLRNTQNQISEVQQQLIQAGNASGAETVFSAVNTNIEPIIDMIRRDAMSGNLREMPSYSSSITVLINQREDELAQMDFDDQRLRDLRNDEYSYQILLEANSDRVHAPEPGIISFKLDGQENSLDFEYLLNGDASDICRTISNSDGAITSDLVISADDGGVIEPVCRIAKNEEQMFAVYLEDDDINAVQFAEDTYHTINVSSEGISIDRCEVVRSVPTANGLLVVFRTTRYVEDLLDFRTIDIEIVISETTGLRVPASALVNPDYKRNVGSVYVNNQGFVEEVSVIIADTDREFVIISPIGDSPVPNDQTVIISNPSTVRVGEKLN